MFGRICAIVILVIVLLLSSLTASAYAQSKIEFASEVALWSDLKETFQDADGFATAEYDYRLAPLAFGFSAGLTDSWALDGRFMYSHLYATDNLPAWSFSTNYVGTTMEVEGALARYLMPGVKVRAGVSHIYLDRTLNVFSGGRYSPQDVATTLTGPVIGIAADASDLGSIIAKGGVDFYPYITQRDSFAVAANSTSSHNFGYRLSGTVGYRFTDSFSVTGSAMYRPARTRYGSDGPDAKQKMRWRSFAVGIMYVF